MARVIVNLFNASIIKKPINIEIDGFIKGKFVSNELLDILVFSGKHTIQALSGKSKSSIIEFNIHEREKVFFSCSTQPSSGGSLHLETLKRSLQPQRFNIASSMNRPPTGSTPLTKQDEAYYYNILGVNEHASNEDIRKAYISLMKEYHPDRATRFNDKIKNQIGDKAMEANLAYGYIKMIRNII